MLCVPKAEGWSHRAALYDFKFMPTALIHSAVSWQSEPDPNIEAKPALEQVRSRQLLPCFPEKQTEGSRSTSFAYHARLVSGKTSLRTWVPD